MENKIQKINLYDFQQEALEATKDFTRVAYYLDMGLGKTFVGSEKAWALEGPILVVCQKSKVGDWVNHFGRYYSCTLYDKTATPKKQLIKSDGPRVVYIVNYEIVWRREEFKALEGYVLLLDESSCIQNETAKRTKFITRSLRPAGIVLLSGTPCNGKYENLWTQCNLLGYKISKNDYWNSYIRWHEIDKNGFPVRIVTGYFNVMTLKDRLREHGAIFKKSSEVFSLPEQVITDIKIDTTPDYKTFYKNHIVTLKNGLELVGVNPLTTLLYLRQLASGYNPNKASALSDLLESTEDRFIIFYNFDKELEALKAIATKAGRPVSEVNGHNKDLTAYEQEGNSLTLVQYQSGAMGLNLQKANKVIFFSPPLSCELYLQAFKRIHRIGQEKTCFYYRLITNNTIETNIYKVLEKREDYTLALFEKTL